MKFKILIFFTLSVAYGQCNLLFAQKNKIKPLANNSFKIRFNNAINGQPIMPDSMYTNNYNEPYAVTQLKYYISNISLTTQAGKQVPLAPSYYLINNADSSTCTLALSTSLANFTAIHFLLGIDSVHNTIGVQTAALDPLNGMFWTWRTGYIMAKLEAVSPLSNAPQQKITYHIGGFEHPNNVVKKITIPLQQPVKLSNSKKTTIVINANINNWFSGVHTIKIAEHNFCMNPGALANKIAANYATMFSLETVSN
jgi:hypothetical protein